MKKYVIVNSQDCICGRYDTLAEAYYRMSKLSHLKTYRILVEINLIDFDAEVYYRLDGTKYNIA